MDYVALGNRIRQSRAKNGLTQEKLASLADLSVSFFGHIERGSRIASMETIVKIANALHVSTDHLLLDSLSFIDDTTIRQHYKATDVVEKILIYIQETFLSTSVD